tara:strand:+ start:796 stop:3189 length:2394 start_codon:yes stop_codon:yes gene_type:complete
MASVNTIIIKNSSTTGAVPGASDLQHGELALNTADGLLFTKQTDNTIIKIAGDNLSLTNEVVNDGAANEGAKINLINALASGNVNEGSFTIEGSSTVTVTHDASNNKVVLSSGGGTVSGISSGGTTVSPAAGVIDFVGGNGIAITANDGSDNLTVAISGADSSSNAVSGVKTYSTQQIFNAGLTTGNGDTSAGFIHFLEDSDDGTNKVILQGASSAGDITLTLPVVTSTTLVGEAGAQTLTQKTIDLGSNTLTGSLAEFNTALQGDSFVSLTGNETLTNKTLTAPTINAATVTGAVAGNFTLVFEGATADDFETTLTVADPTADRTITLPNVTGTVVTTGDTGSVTNTMLAGSIANGKLVNSTVTLQGDNNSATLDLGGTLKIGSNDAALTSAASTTGGGVDQVMFSVNVDDSSIEIDGTNGLQVKASGVTNAMLAGSIADSKLNKITTADKVGAQSIDITSATDGSSGAGAFNLGDNDFFLVHDTDNGGTKKVLMSQLETYVGIGAGGLAISSIDIDGGTDINADLVDGDLFIVDDGANGTNRKSAISRIGDYVFNKISNATGSEIAITDAGIATINADSVVMGTDTTGNFVQTIAVGSNLQTTGASSGENIAHTINLATNPDVAGTLDVTGDVTMDADASVAGNLTVTGNLEVNGTTTTVNTDNLSVEDSLIELARGNTADTLDIGFFGQHDSSTQLRSGLVRDADHGTTVNGVTLPEPFVLFTDHGTAPGSGTVDFTGTEGTDWSYAPLAVGHISLGASGASGTAHIKRIAAGSGSLANIVGEIKHFKIDGGTY